MEKAYREALDRVSVGETVAVATVVRTWGSAPHPPGAAMLVTRDGLVVGNVSGGCVEADLVAVSHEVLASGGAQRKRYGFAGDDPVAVGLTCGGELDVFVEPVGPARRTDLENLLDAHAPHVAATVLTHPSPDKVGARLTVTERAVGGTTGSPGTDATLAEDARALLRSGHTTVRWYDLGGARQEEGCAQAVEVFLRPSLPPARMLVFGAADFVRTTAQLGKFLGYQVTVCDARAAFATHARFPQADEVVVRWPVDYLTAEVRAGRVDSRTVVLVLTHDPRFDVPLLVEALKAGVSYVGAMGSRRTHRERLSALRAAGASEEELVRLRSPIGLDLGGRTAEETAVSIAAELIAVRNGRSGLPLRAVDGSLH